MLVFIMIHAGFACSFFLLVQRSSSQAESGGATLGTTFIYFWFVALGDNLGGIVDTYRDTESPALTLIIYLAWVLVSSVLMLNLL